MDIQASKLNWLLTVAERLQTFFSKSDDTLTHIVKDIIKRNHAVAAHGCIASEAYPFMIVSTNPKQLLLDITEALKDKKEYQDSLNPINIIMKLINQEYMLDLNGTKFCYAVQTSIASNYLLKVFACKILANVRDYNNYIDPDTNTMISDKIKELHPLYDYNTNSNRQIGGKKRKHNSKDKRKGNVRIDILSSVMEFVRSNQNAAGGIIFVNDLEECSATAMNLIYTDHKSKMVLVDYLKQLIPESYKQYSFKAFLHADFNVPYDFRMKKHSCLINDKNTKQATYLINMYDIATYMPLPCVKSVIKDTFIHIAHPVVKLWILYIDMYMIEHRLNEANPQKHEQVYLNKMMKVYNDLTLYDKTPTWVGFFIDESYDKIKYNMQMKMANPIETILL